MREIKQGDYTLADLQKINALLDMQGDVQDRADEDMRKGGGKHGSS